MTVARPIFTLGGQVQLFWTAFDMPVTGVPLEVALGYKKIVFGHFKKIIMETHLYYTCMIIFFETPKNKISAILMQLLMVPLSRACQKLSKTMEPIHVK